MFEVSAATHEGLRELTYALGELVQSTREQMPDVPPQRIVLRPTGTAPVEFAVEQVDGGWRVRGEKPERWVRQTDFGNDEAVGYLADRLNRLGVEDRLLQLGAQVGDDVMIGGDDDAVVFEFDPTVQAGAETMLGRRGQDLRLEGR